MLKLKFPLRKYSLNSALLLSKLSELLLEKSLIVSLSEKNVMNTLGMKWDTSNDFIKVFTNASLSTQKITKWEVLLLISKQYDPMDLSAPVRIRGKLIMQEFWKSGIYWDDPIPKALACKFRAYQSDICKLKKVSICRYFGSFESKKKYTVFVTLVCWI